MSSEVTSEPVSALPYAHFEPRPASRGWAGAAIIGGGLGLILLGGCFLIGVLSIVHPGGPSGTRPLPVSATALMWVLYILAFACFGGAAIMLFSGTRSLLRIMRG